MKSVLLIIIIALCSCTKKLYETRVEVTYYDGTSELARFNWHKNDYPLLEGGCLYDYDKSICGVRTYEVKD